MKTYLPQSTLTYMVNRSKRRRKPFINWIGDKLNKANEDARIAEEENKRSQYDRRCLSSSSLSIFLLLSRGHIVQPTTSLCHCDLIPKKIFNQPSLPKQSGKEVDPERRVGHKQKHLPLFQPQW